MSEPSRDGDDVIVVESELDAPPEKVWRALTEPALAGAWLPPDGSVRRVLEARPPERLRLGWGVPGALDSEVTFVLSPLPQHRTLLRVVHDGFRLPAANGNRPPLARAA